MKNDSEKIDLLSAAMSESGLDLGGFGQIEQSQPKIEPTLVVTNGNKPELSKISNAKPVKIISTALPSSSLVKEVFVAGDQGKPVIVKKITPSSLQQQGLKPKIIKLSDLRTTGGPIYIKKSTVSVTNVMKKPMEGLRTIPANQTTIKSIVKSSNTNVPITILPTTLSKGVRTSAALPQTSGIKKITAVRTAPGNHQVVQANRFLVKPAMVQQSSSNRVYPLKVANAIKTVRPGSSSSSVAVKSRSSSDVNSMLYDKKKFMKVMYRGVARFVPITQKHQRFHNAKVAQYPSSQQLVVNRQHSRGVDGGTLPASVVQSYDQLYSVVNPSVVTASSLNGRRSSLNSGRISSLPNSPKAPSSAMKTKEQKAATAKRKKEEQEKRMMIVSQEDDDHEDLQHDATYHMYMPMKLAYGMKHPDNVVETSSLASIDPPDISYSLQLPRAVIEQGKLSAIQLESIVYACQKHETILPSGERAGFLIGDGAGVGKGRTIAGIIYENYLQGRKRALWFSVSNDLKRDAERDLKDIGAKIKVHSLNKFKYKKITHKLNGAFKKGVVFCTYSSLISESKAKKDGGKYTTRLSQLLHWCGDDFDGVIVFDESHKAKNIGQASGVGRATKTASTVIDIQSRLPKARVVYASATGASEPRHMAYMSRVGLWGKRSPFKDFNGFIQAIEKRGVGAMELVAMDMKLRGCYIARQLSFHGVKFEVVRVKLDCNFVQLYNKSVKLWVLARSYFQKAASLIEAEQSMKKSMWSQFWSAHQRFFKYMCMAAKVDTMVNLCQQKIENGKCVVIGLQSTGEANTQDELAENDGEFEDFVSTAKAVLQNLVRNHFPAINRDRIKEMFGANFYKPKVIASSQNDEKEKEYVNSNKRKHSVDEDDEIEDEPLRKISRRSIWAGGDNSDDDYDDVYSNGSGSDDDDGGMYMKKFVFGDSDDDDDSDAESPKKKMKKKKNGYRSSSPSSASESEEKDNNVESENVVKDEEEKLLNPQAAARDAKKNMLLENLDVVAGTSLSDLPGSRSTQNAQTMKTELLEKIEALGSCLPVNVLDDLVDKLGGPEKVAEMTGRKGRIVSSIEDGTCKYVARAESNVPLQSINMTEKERFMRGEKNVAIISDAASSGISLQSDKRVANQRQRVHVTLELPWSGDKAIQQFGRTHRSNQRNPPEYIFMITELAGEQRFASVVAKRLESLGALTHGDRRASDVRDLSEFNYDNKYGRKALEIVMKCIARQDRTLVPPPKSYKGNFLQDVREACLGVGLISQEKEKDEGSSSSKQKQPNQYQLDKDYNNLFKFMNRMLGMEVELQNGLFVFFSDTLKAVIQEAKTSGLYDQGIVDIGCNESSVEHLDKVEFELTTNNGRVSLHKVKTDRGFRWEQAIRLESESFGEVSGFYASNDKTQQTTQTVLLALQVIERKSSAWGTFTVYRPNIGKQTITQTIEKIRERYFKCTREHAERLWKAQYDASTSVCRHEYCFGTCEQSASSSRRCVVGLRSRIYNILCGSVLSVWKKVEDLIQLKCGGVHKMQVIRLKTSSGGKLVGLLIPNECVANLKEKLECEEDSAAPSTQNSDEYDEEYDDYDEELSSHDTMQYINKTLRKQKKLTTVEREDMLINGDDGNDDYDDYYEQDDDDDDDIDPDDFQSSVLSMNYK